MGASGSELSIGGATTSATVGTKTSTSIRRRHSSTNHHQRLDSRVSLQAGMTSRRSSHHRISITEDKLSEAIGGTSIQIKIPILTDKFAAASRLNPVTAKEDSNHRPLRTSLKRRKSVFVAIFPPLLKDSPVLCIPSCISDKDMVG